jgi:UDP-glucuronate 4-epimerase
MRNKARNKGQVESTSMSSSGSPILVTGAAGFIGFHVSRMLLERGERVIGIDNINDYYDVSLKEARLDILKKHSEFTFQKLDILDREGLEKLFKEHSFERVIHLAALAGVRYSIENPLAYIESNVVGFANILEECRNHSTNHLVYASSSSVYGGNVTLPFSTSHSVDHPLSLYAATKKSNELTAHSYSHLYEIPTTGLRFFTAYGPWGRPDMAMFIFIKKILADEAIDVFNHGNMLRDFTYIDDIAEGVIRTLDHPPSFRPDLVGKDTLPNESQAPYRVYNIGNQNPVQLLDLIKIFEKRLGKEVKMNMLPMQPGDVPAAVSDVSDLIEDVGFKPETTIEDGVNRFIDWYLDFYGHESLKG